jgi:hypothetical protein
VVGMTTYKCLWCFRGFTSSDSVVVCPHCGGLNTVHGYANTCAGATMTAVLTAHRVGHDLSPVMEENVFRAVAEQVREDIELCGGCLHAEGDYPVGTPARIVRRK